MSGDVRPRGGSLRVEMTYAFSAVNVWRSARLIFLGEDPSLLLSLEWVRRDLRSLVTDCPNPRFKSMKYCYDRFSNGYRHARRCLHVRPTLDQCSYIWWRHKVLRSLVFVCFSRTNILRTYIHFFHSRSLRNIFKLH